MIRLALVLAGAVTLLLLLLGAGEGRPPAATSRVSIAVDGQEAVPGELLVKARPGGVALRRLTDRWLGNQELAHIEELRLARLRLAPGLTIGEAERLYEALPLVEYAEPNYIYRVLDFPKDPFYAGFQRWYYELIEGPAAWDLETGDPSVLVAVVDTGVDVNHPDLQASIWNNSAEAAVNGIDDDGNGCVDDLHGCNFVEPDTADPACIFRSGGPTRDVRDDDGHGTFVSGVIAASTNNELGVAGTARGVTIMPVKVLACTGGGSAADVTAGIIYAAQSGADVMNLSFGGRLESDALTDAIKLAHDEFGVLLVAAAGNNDHADVSFPARLPEVVAVGASDHDKPDTRAAFSNWGPEVDVAAPGVDITSTVPEAVCGPRWRCLSRQPYATASGTSFSAPQVSGLAALILSRSPGLTHEEVRDIIKSTALSMEGGRLNWAGSGRIRMRAALEAVGGGVTPAPTPPVVQGPVDLVVGCQLKALTAWSSGTPLTDVTAGISAPGANPRLWFQVPGTLLFELFDPRSPERSTMTVLGPGDEAAVVCVDAPSPWDRPGS